MDTWGIGALALGIGALQVVLDKGQEKDWFGSHMIVTLSIVCVSMLTAFVIRELMAEHPVVNLRVFRNRTYAAGTGLMTMLGFVLYGSMVALPIFLQTLLDYTSERAGITMMPRGLGSFVAMPVVGILVGRLDPRKMLVAGSVGAGVSIMALSRLDLDAGYWNLFLPQFFQGIFTAMLFVPLTTVTMDPIRAEEMGNATSLFNLMRNIGGSIGIATATTLIARTSQTFQNDLVKYVNPYRITDQSLLMQLRRYFISRGSDAVTALHQAYAALNGMVGQQAALLAYINEFKFFGIVSIAMVPLVFLMRRPRGRRGPVAMH